MISPTFKPACEISTESQGAMAVVQIRGFADLTSVDLIHTELNKVLATRPQTLVFDLKDLDFISSLVVGSLVSAAKATRRDGGTARITNAQPMIAELMRVTHLETLFEFERVS